MFSSTIEGMREIFVSKNKTYERAFAQEMEQMKQMFDRWRKSTDDSVCQVDRIKQRVCAEVDRTNQRACAEVCLRFLLSLVFIPSILSLGIFRTLLCSNSERWFLYSIQSRASS